MVLVVCASPVAGLDLPVLRHTRSSLLTEGTPDVAFGEQTHPKVRATSRGYCATWFDTRQGGMLMAARIAPDGTVVDPLGIPIAPSEKGILFPDSYESWTDQYWKVDILVDGDRCVVLHGRGSEVMGTSLALVGDPAARTEAFVRLGGVSFSVAAVDGDRAVFIEREQTGIRLTLVRNDGAIEWSHSITTQLYVARVALTGTTARVFVKRSLNTGYLDLWQVDGQGATMFPTKVRTSESYRWNVVSAGESVVLVDLDPYYEPETVRIDRVGPTGGIEDSVTIPGAPANGYLEQLWHDGGGAGVLIRESSGLTLLRHREGVDPEVRVLPDVYGAFVAPGPTSLSLWRPGDSKLKLGFGPPGVTAGSPLTRGLRPELVADAVALPGALAVAWVEQPAGGQPDELHFGLVDPETLTLTRDELVTAGAIVGGTTVSEGLLPRVAIERNATGLLLAWIEGGALRIRRAALDGSWAGLPVTLSESAATLHPDGLVPLNDGLLLVWTEALDSRWRAPMRAVWVGPAGQIVPRDPPDGLGDPALAWASAASMDDGIAIAVRHRMPDICNITCVPTYTIDLLSLTTDGVWIRLEHDLRYLSTSGNPGIIGQGKSLLVISDGVVSMVRDGARLKQWAFLRIASSGGLFRNGGLYLVGRGRTQPGGSRFTHVTRPTSARYSEPAVTIPDVASTSWFLPKLVELNGRLYLFGSEVSLEPDEGSVPRLRVHEIVEEAVRQRGVRSR